MHDKLTDAVPLYIETLPLQLLSDAQGSTYLQTEYTSVIIMHNQIGCVLHKKSFIYYAKMSDLPCPLYQKSWMMLKIEM